MVWPKLKFNKLNFVAGFLILVTGTIISGKFRNNGACHQNLNGPVNKEETEQFLRKQILEPMECYVSAESVPASPKPAR
jgi:hypothetical protein